MVSAAIGTEFVQETADAARAPWRKVADQLRAKYPSWAHRKNWDHFCGKTTD